MLTESDTGRYCALPWAQRGLESVIKIGRVDRDALAVELARWVPDYVRVGDRSAAACSPTKIAEYLAAGLPVVASSGMGDIDCVLRNYEGRNPSATDRQPVGVLVDERDPQDLERAALELTHLMDDVEIRVRCRAVADRAFNLETAGWARYRRAYASVIGHPRPEQGWSGFVPCSRERSHGIEPIMSANGLSLPTTRPFPYYSPSVDDHSRFGFLKPVR